MHEKLYIDYIYELLYIRVVIYTDIEGNIKFKRYWYIQAYKLNFAKSK